MNFFALTKQDFQHNVLDQVNLDTLLDHLTEHCHLARAMVEYQGEEYYCLVVMPLPDDALVYCFPVDEDLYASADQPGPCGLKLFALLAEQGQFEDLDLADDVMLVINTALESLTANLTGFAAVELLNVLFEVDRQSKPVNMTLATDNVLASLFTQVGLQDVQCSISGLQGQFQILVWSDDHCSMAAALQLQALLAEKESEYLDEIISAASQQMNVSLGELEVSLQYSAGLELVKIVVKCASVEVMTALAIAQSAQDS